MNEEKGIVDRFAEDFAVIEIDGETRDVPRSHVAEDVKEGDVVVLNGGLWARHDQATADRSAQIKKLMDSVWDD